MPGTVTLHCGDCLDILDRLPADHFDAVVTDPPYHLASIVKRFGGDASAPAQFGTDGAFARASKGFLGKEWDGGDIAFRPETWAKVARVMKPGAHLVAFNHSRTWFDMAVAIRAGGLEIRDTLAWLYGTGFPKSHNIEKAIDKLKHDTADILAVTAWVRAARDRAGVANADIDRAFGFSGMAGHWTSQGSQPAVPTLEQVPALLAVLKVEEAEVPEEIRRLLVEINTKKGQPGQDWEKREVVARVTEGAIAGFTKGADRETSGFQREYDVTAPASDRSAEWSGWGTCLKPAFEPIVLARKPLAESSVARQVLATRTGGLNVAAGRVPGLPGEDSFPANVCHDGSPEVLGCFPFDNTGRTVSRFFYCAKATDDDRQGSDHPTVKPQALMRWLARITTPKGGLILDPFGGSGSTAWAASAEGFDCDLIEREPEYQAHIARRIETLAAPLPADIPAPGALPGQLSLFS